MSEVYHQISLLILRFLRQISDLFKPLPPEQIDFMRKNAVFWEDYGTHKGLKNDPEYVLAAITEAHPVILLSNASFATIVAQAKRLRLLFISSFPTTNSMIRTLKSYPNSTIVYMYNWRYILKLIGSFVPALRAYYSIKTPKDILDFEVDGIRFGDAIYDGILARGFATIKVVDWKVLIELLKFYFFRSLILELLKKYKIQTSVFTHTVGLPGATFSRYLLQRNIEVLNRAGSHQIIVRKYSDLKKRDYILRPEQRYFQKMMDNDHGTIVTLAEDYINRRFNQEISQLAVTIAFNSKKKTYTDQQTFCSEYSLDHTKPLVFVMLHEFTDFPHSHFVKPMIFQDYYVWLMRTLEIAKTVKSVNWIFKEHPAAKYYPTKDFNLSVFFEGIKFNHIRFLDSEADFNARSLKYIAYAIITCLGTAGLEYATQGIPCVLGGESPYSGFGLTIEPIDAEEYEACLRGVGHMQRLSIQQVKGAKIMLLFQYYILQKAEYYFCPRFDDNEVPEWNNKYEKRLWTNAVSAFDDQQYVKKMRSQVEELSRFVCDSSWTQYIDLNQFPFLKEGLAEKDTAIRI